MQNIFTTELVRQHRNKPARITKVTTPHGSFTTPTFMPVGTRAAVNCLSSHELHQTGSQIILGGNTYHMLVAPGMDIIEAAGGMHKMMGWQGPMLTDSGGFQVFSLSKNSDICKINDRGAVFKHPIDGRKISMTPKISIETQKIIGADIIMVFDECTPEKGGRQAALKAMERTRHWLGESIETHLKHPNSIYGFRQALFGIIQGGSYKDLRLECTQEILSADLDGIAIGGELIGFDMEKTIEVLNWVCSLLPHNKTRYTMGVGLKPQDLIDVTAQGVDIFDCVAPTRNARHGSLYHGTLVKENDWLRFDSDTEGRILIKKSIYAKDDSPILADCDCYTCQNYSRAYLHFLFKTRQALYAPLACCHNIRVMQKTCEMIQAVILKNSDQSK